MEFYSLFRHLHIVTAVITAALMLLRLGLDALGQPQWRRTPLRWLPHANDTLLLASALGLVWISGWMPLVHHWLTLKILLLVGYILAGKKALETDRPQRGRVVAAILALAQLSLIFLLALFKPV